MTINAPHARAVIPDGISGSRFLALGCLGDTATTSQVREWLRQAGTLEPAQVRTGLHSLTRRKPPLIEMTQRGRAGYGAPNHWRLTEHGHAALAEDEDGQVPCGTGWPHD